MKSLQIRVTAKVPVKHRSIGVPAKMPQRKPIALEVRKNTSTHELRPHRSSPKASTNINHLCHEMIANRRSGQPRETINLQRKWLCGQDDQVISSERKLASLRQISNLTGKSPQVKERQGGVQGAKVEPARVPATDHRRRLQSRVQKDRHEQGAKTDTRFSGDDSVTTGRLSGQTLKEHSIKGKLRKQLTRFTYIGTPYSSECAFISGACGIQGAGRLYDVSFEDKQL